MDEIIPKILIKTSLGYHGVAGVTFNYFKFMNKDHMKIDFVVTDEVEDMREDFVNYINSNKSNIYFVPKPYKEIFKYILSMRKLLKSNNYQLIHIHGNSANMFLDVFIAALSGVKVRITHSHNTKNKFTKLHNVLKPFLNLTVTDRFACSNEAGKWLYDDKPFKVIQNGINFNEYKFDNKIRGKVRSEMSLMDELVLLHVGTFTEQKNHDYILEIFKELVKIHKNSVLIMIGEGERKEDIKRKVLNLGFMNKVHFIGNTSEVSRYYNVADVFIMPSKYEGLPLVLVEAQVSGLPCIISDNITNEVGISNRIVKISLTDSPKLWAEKIILPNTLNKNRHKPELNKNSVFFDIKKNANELHDLYIERITRSYIK